MPISADMMKEIVYSHTNWTKFCIFALIGFKHEEQAHGNEKSLNFYRTLDLIIVQNANIITNINISVYIS